MKADAITAKILEDARDQAKALIDDAHEKAEALRRQGEAEMEEKRQESEKQADLLTASMPGGRCSFLPCFGASKLCLFCPCRPITAEEQRKSAAEAALFCYLGAYAKRMLSSLSAAL